MKTIVAISTPSGSGGIGILRVSGKEAVKIADAVFLVKGNPCAEVLRSNPLKMCFGEFVGEDFSDKGYAVYFPEGKSFTGEDTVEFYLHGGVRIMRGALRSAISKGCVTAEAGEFTKRAYLNGRMSLADAEGVADMINAESSAGLRAAYRLMQGGVSAKVNEITDDLLDVIATLEASLDYPDEMEDEVIPTIEDRIPSILARIHALASTSYIGRMAKSGINVVIAGEPNVGKSSLLNAILGEDKAIVTDIAGTTRDAISGSVEVDGVLINFTDTAGLRNSDDTVESIGVERAKKAIEGADEIVYVFDGTKGGNLPDEVQGKDNVFVVYNKCDREDFIAPDKTDRVYCVSAKTGDGVENLKSALSAIYRDGEVDGADVITSERHLSALYRAENALEHAVLAKDETIDCVLIDLREGYDALGEITGATAGEDVVDGIFSKFCVGK